jgi:protein tyrosine phosphatase (PTP) superfamily phosphohydrolase (DUF442 family)
MIPFNPDKCRVKPSIGALGFVFLAALLGAAPVPRTELPVSNRFEHPANVEAPVVLCIDDKPAAGGQPSSSAYAKAAANGFRSVLTLRSKQDGVELLRERLMVEQNKMRYFNISVAKGLPQRKQVDEFLRLTRDRANHPMLINCAFIERVAPLMMIFHIVEQGWTEERAIEEASRSGIKSDSLKKFAREYLAPATKRTALTR